MQNRRASLCLINIVLAVSFILAGCAIAADKDSVVTVTPIQDEYEYKQREKVCFFPSFTNEKTEVLSVSTEDGVFTCMTTDKAEADAFINAQRTLLKFLDNNGVELRELNYVAINFDDDFSDGANNTAYIALSSTGTWRQVLVTLQALWGDYTDYGYVYAMSNAIALHLDWEADTRERAEAAAMGAFFCENPRALNLLYPTFTVSYATEETVRYSKALSLDLFEKVDLCKALKKPMEAQLDEFDLLLREYADKIGATYSRQKCGYAYRGPYLPLCIQTTYATHIIDHGYRDYFSYIYEDYFVDYLAIYQTAEILDSETVAAVERFSLEDRAGKVTVKWLSEESAMAKVAKPKLNVSYVEMKESYITTVLAYMHEYYHHIEYLINPESAKSHSWQSLAFCEIGRVDSSYSLYATETTYTQDDEMAELFYSFTGHAYQSGTDDYFEANDIECYAFDDFVLDGSGSVAPLDSFNRYLIKAFGEDTVINLMLYPDTVVDVTGKNWDTLQEEWKQFIKDKYAGKEIPDWVSEY